MTGEVTIRQLGEHEVETFRALKLEALERSPETILMTLAEERDKPVEHFAGQLREWTVFVAEQAGTPVGMIVYWRYRPAKKRHVGFLGSLFVRPQARGQGIGRRLSEAAIALAGEEVELLELVTEATNAPALALYGKLGFEEWGRQPMGGKIGDRYHDVVFLQKRLGG